MVRKTDFHILFIFFSQITLVQRELFSETMNIERENIDTCLCISRILLKKMKILTSPVKMGGIIISTDTIHCILVDKTISFAFQYPCNDREVDYFEIFPT